MLHAMSQALIGCATVGLSRGACCATAASALRTPYASTTVAGTLLDGERTNHASPESRAMSSSDSSKSQICAACRSLSSCRLRVNGLSPSCTAQRRITCAAVLPSRPAMCLTCASSTAFILEGQSFSGQ